MPAVLPGQNGNYTNHQRQQSSQSQMSLPDQVRTPQPYQPEGSAVLLPATTYNQSDYHQACARAPSSPNNLARLDTSVSYTPAQAQDQNLAGSANLSSFTDPDDFYRHYSHDQQRNVSSGGSLHQDALRTLSPREHSQTRVGSNGSYSTNWSADDPRDTTLPPNVPGLKSRKSSVKNLVAQINASSTADVPPIPTQAPNKYTVYSTSPYLSSSHVSHFGGVRKYSESASTSSSTHDRNSRAGEQQDSQRRPLFGEILPGLNAPQSAGYGIANPRRRTASESSPMHSPNPMFPPEQRDSQFVLSPKVYVPTTDKNEHRRTNSDMVHNSSHRDGVTSPSLGRRPPVTSRIPVSTRRLSAASDSGHSTPNSRAPSALESGYTNKDSRSHARVESNPGQSLSVEQQTPGRITSPGRRGKTPKHQQTNSQQGAKSPLLRANIIAPPPKISPPLRSSRPRLPVSSASTAASRARIAERINSMQKSSERRSSQQRRSKPPELTDVDLNARRLRITQALTRSRESEELKVKVQSGTRWEPGSGSASPRPSSTVEESSTVAPRISIEEENGQRQSDVFDVELDRHYATRNALHAIHGQETDEIDSPTLGQDAERSHDKPAMFLQTNLLNVRDHAEPASAVTDATADTEATHIDPEPQDDDNVDAPTSLLNHVRQMRDESPARQYEASPYINNYDREDRTDVESVNLVLRNTTYLDDDEAIRKGYRMNFDIPEPLPEEPEDHASARDSWTSSMHEEPENDDGYFQSEVRRGSGDFANYEQNHEGRPISSYQSQDESFRNTMASDAYTIMNIVLQEHSSSGIIDQEFANDVYQKVLETCPEIENEGAYDSGKIEQLCLQELNRRDTIASSTELQQDEENPEDVTTPQQETHGYALIPDHRENEVSELPAANENLLTLPPTAYQSHRHKSSLDSADDWASTSPSVGDWARFAAETEASSQYLSHHDSSREQTDPPQPNSNVPSGIDKHASVAQSQSTRSLPLLAPLPDDDPLGPEEYGIAIIRAPSNSPPPPPKDHLPSIEQMARSSMPGSSESDVRMPRVPHRMASLGQTSTPRQSQSSSRPPSDKSRADITPWETQDLPPTPETLSPEARRIKQRKHVIKELVDTENSYQKDMRVLCDIYKPTATAALSEEDIHTLFGNVEQVQVFARDFLTALKQTTKPAYSADRKKEKKDGLDNLMHYNSSSSTLASTKIESEISDIQKDRETRIGDAFDASLKDMEVVYTEYIRNRHSANQRLEALQRSPAAQEWLKECRDNSSDITNAWNLDALLVKPVQRITKYPLLLKELIDATTEDHPDLPTLRGVLISVTDINIRINDVKKHAEMLDQAINRKRGQSDVRAGLTKAFGRRAEKLKQHVGIADMYEDSEYDKLRIAYDNNYVQLMVVANDCLTYEKGMTQWVNRMVEMAAGAEGWVDVGHSHHQQEESKLRHLAMIIKNVHNIALPDHIEHLQKKVIKPMTTTVDMLQKFKDDPKGLLHKRDKRLVDYAQMKNRKDRGEKIDKKSAERMDQWEALNTEAKERMRKLLRATAHLVQSCQGHLVHLQMSWMAMIQQKLSRVMGINLSRLSVEEIERTWQEDFDYQEASALALSICNGSLMLQAANMTSFLTPSSTLNGEDSPRQMSVSSTNKRSISMHSETSTVPTLDANSSRPSATYSQALPENAFDRPYPSPNRRNRAISSTSGKSTQRPELSSRSVTNHKHTSASANFSRPGTSPVIQQDVFAPPRLSVETYSPLMSSFQAEALPNNRPASSNTFFSASDSQPGSHRPRGSGVFSSALPMSDSPAQERLYLELPSSDNQVLFTAASVYEFNIDRARREAGFPYLTYVTGEIFDVIGEKGELWLAKNQDDPNKQIGWIWNKHFAKLAE